MVLKAVRRKPARACGEHHQKVMWKPDDCAVGERPIGCAIESLRILELFSGTGSVGAVFAARGHSVTSVDVSDASGYQPTHKENILFWNYTEYPSCAFDVIWASPPCEHYSIARTTAKSPRNLEYYDSLVAKTLEIVNWFQPKFFFVENPRHGLLRTRDVVKDIPYKDVDYCKYGTVYRKPTRVWGRLPTRWAPRPLCKRDCPACGSTRKHLQHAQRRNGFSIHNLHILPRPLIEEIAEACERSMNDDMPTELSSR